MSGHITYMGTKHDLAGRVAAVIADCRSGRLLDAFAGMGAVADAHSGRRQVWTNDVQHFAYLSGRCRFTGIAGPMSGADMRDFAHPLFRLNLETLREHNDQLWRVCERMVSAQDFKEFDNSFRSLSSSTIKYPEAYGCFTATYSNAYFSLEQCAEIDSIRFSIDNLYEGRILDSSQYSWALLALGRAALRVANTTGHFAQFLKPNEKNFRRIAQQFRRSVFKEWIVSLDVLKPSGSPDWRRQNIATRADSHSLLGSIGDSADLGVVYCDPPYTDDQYSRFYHVWETLILNDYPSVTGAGLYRKDRFTTDFSLRSKVQDAFKSLIREIARTGADLVLSYPSNGLLHETGANPLDILREFYPQAKLAAEIEYKHSTMGASKGRAKASVAECLYLARA